MAVRTNTLDSQNNRNMVWDATTSRWVNQTQTDTVSLEVLSDTLTEAEKINKVIEKLSESYLLMEQMYTQLIVMNQLTLRIADLFSLFFGEGVRLDKVEDITENL